MACIPLLLTAPWIIISDINSRRIPNLSLLVLWVLIEISDFGDSWRTQLALHELAVSLLVGGILINLVTRESIGMGDVKLISLIGLMIGRTNLVLEGLTYSAILGLFWVAIARKRSIPFAPSLIIGALLVAVGL